LPRIKGLRCRCHFILADIGSS